MLFAVPSITDGEPWNHCCIFRVTVVDATALNVTHCLENIVSAETVVVDTLTCRIINV